MTIRTMMVLIGSFIFAMAVTYATPAQAQATRTWVSGVGDDANPCSRTAPCKTFAGAISKTAAGGEINCIDPGAFGAVTITKSISIICDDVEAGILNAGTNGVTVNAAATDTVFLSGLDFLGTSTSLSGIRFLAGGALHVENSTIRMNGSTGGLGISFAPSATSQLTVVNTTIARNGNAATGGGIEIKPTGTGVAKVTLRSVTLLENANNGLRIDTTGNTGTGNAVTVTDSLISGGAQGIAIVTPPGQAGATLMLVNSTIANNTGVGLVVNGAAAVARVGNTTITGNNFGVVAGGGGNAFTYGDNRLDGNGTNGAFTTPAIPKQ